MAVSFIKYKYYKKIVYCSTVCNRKKLSNVFKHCFFPINIFFEFIDFKFYLKVIVISVTRSVKYNIYI